MVQSRHLYTIVKSEKLMMLLSHLFAALFLLCIISKMIKAVTRTMTATAKMTDMERDVIASLEAEVLTLRVSQLILTSMEVLEISLDVEYSNLW